MRKTTVADVTIRVLYHFLYLYSTKLHIAPPSHVRALIIITFSRRKLMFRACNRICTVTISSPKYLVTVFHVASYYLLEILARDLCESAAVCETSNATLHC
ncbi:hypothetical protein VNO77_17625 [Canavalia gladiata]|uniref:Uncharacterized protein n=1 Tax=Canavalia gladiata TaxID=3824 RepID=A0AAN9LJH8_CANGL